MYTEFRFILYFRKELVIVLTQYSKDIFALIHIFAKNTKIILSGFTESQIQFIGSLGLLSIFGKNLYFR